jgi:hypothetical protein
MRFEISMAVIILILVFWVVTLCGFTGRYQLFGGTYTSVFSPEDGISIFFHTALLPRRQTSTSSVNVLKAIDTLHLLRSYDYYQTIKANQ